MKNNKRWPHTVLALSLLLISFSSKAQFYLGIEGGWNYNHLHTSVGYREFTKYENVNGYTIGIPEQYQVNNWLAIRSGLSFIQKNYQLTRTHYYSGVYHKSTNNYLQLPVAGNFIFGTPRIKGFVNLGGYIGYWMSTNNKGVSFAPYFQSDPSGDNYGILPNNEPHQYNEKYAFDSRKDRRVELGWLAGGGVSYEFAQKYRLFIEYRYYHAITDQQKSYSINQIPRYNETGVIQVGCLFRLGRYQSSTESAYSK